MNKTFMDGLVKLYNQFEELRKDSLLEIAVRYSFEEENDGQVFSLWCQHPSMQVDWQTNKILKVMQYDLEVLSKEAKKEILLKLRAQLERDVNFLENLNKIENLSVMVTEVVEDVLDSQLDDLSHSIESVQADLHDLEDSVRDLNDRVDDVECC